MLLNRLRSAFHGNPLIVQSLFCGGCYTGSDFIAQKLEKRYGVESPGKVEYNTGRTMRMGVFGLCFGGPAIFVWYKYLNQMTAVFRYRYVPTSSASSHSWLRTLVEGSYRREILDDRISELRYLAVRLFFDQVFFNAAFVHLYLLIIAVLEGRSLVEAIERCKSKFHDSWAAMFTFWVPIQFVNFTIVPVQFNGIVVMVMNVAWTTLLSLLSHSRDYGNVESVTRSPISHAISDIPESRDSTLPTGAQGHTCENCKTVNDDLDSGSHLKLQALRSQLVERRSQIDEELRTLKTQRRMIDEMLILTDDNQLRRQRQCIQEALQSSPDIHSGDISHFLKLTGNALTLDTKENSFIDASTNHMLSFRQQFDGAIDSLSIGKPHLESG